VDRLLAVTIEEIQIDSRYEFLKEKQFPKLPLLTKKEMMEIVEGLSVNKAITTDGLTDHLFTEEGSGRTAEILKDLWSINLAEVKGIQASLTSRLMLLNKVFPKVPTRKQMRPITISSPLQKISEARFLPKFNTYITQKMTPSQTGFVRGMGTQVNLNRAILKIKQRTENNRIIFGLFVDFANAYNSVPHVLLMEKLRKKKYSMKRRSLLSKLYTLDTE
jgi:hypothetical protein